MAVSLAKIWQATATEIKSLLSNVEPDPDCTYPVKTGWSYNGREDFHQDWMASWLECGRRAVARAYYRTGQLEEADWPLMTLLDWDCPYVMNYTEMSRAEERPMTPECRGIIERHLPLLTVEAQAILLRSRVILTWRLVMAILFSTTRDLMVYFSTAAADHGEISLTSEEMSCSGLLLMSEMSDSGMLEVEYLQDLVKGRVLEKREPITAARVRQVWRQVLLLRREIDIEVYIQTRMSSLHVKAQVVDFAQRLDTAKSLCPTFIQEYASYHVLLFRAFHTSGRLEMATFVPGSLTDYVELPLLNFGTGGSTLQALHRLIAEYDSRDPDYDLVIQRLLQRYPPLE